MWKDDNSSFHIDDQSYQKIYKTIWTKAKYLKTIEFNILSVYNDRYMRTSIRAFGHDVYTNFRPLNLSEDDLEWESFTIISTDCLYVH